MSRDDLSETQRLSGDVSQHIFDEWCGGYGDLHFGGEKFRRAYDEDIERLGLDADDPYLLVIIRESDGKAFDVELEADVREVLSKAERERLAQEHAGQLRLPEVAS